MFRNIWNHCSVLVFFEFFGKTQVLQFQSYECFFGYGISYDRSVRARVCLHGEVRAARGGGVSERTYSLQQLPTLLESYLYSVAILA